MMKHFIKKVRVLKLLLILFIFVPALRTEASVGALKKGMKNNDVFVLQEKLIATGHFKASSTGYFGSVTENSVKAFQKTSKLFPDGVAGGLTLAALDKAVKIQSTCIALDPGHGGEDLGTVSGMLYEKNINLDIANRVKSYLDKQSFNVLLTRNKDISLASRSNIRGSFELKDLDARTKILNKSSVTLFVSIHVDSLPSEPDKNGSIVYYNPEVNGSEELAAKLQNELNKITIKGIKRDSNKPSSADFYILRNTDIPGVLVESGFLTNSTDKTGFQRTAFRDALAKAICDGISDYIK